MRIFVLLIFFVLTLLPLHAEPPPLLTFQSLAVQPIPINSKIRIRGFLYRTPEGLLILSSVPNLKTCCMGQVKKQKSQIAVSGNLPEGDGRSTVTVEGILSKQDPEAPLELRDVSLVEEKRSFWSGLFD